MRFPSLRALEVLSVAFALVACSDGESSTSGNPDSGAADGSIPDGSIADAPTTDAPATDAGAPGDPGDATPPPYDASDVPDGGPPPTPGVVLCGSVNGVCPASGCTQTCDIRTSTCCLQTGDVDAGGSHCILGVSATCPAYEHVAIHCQAAADCASGQVCCRAASGDTACAATCAGAGEMQVCRTHSECTNGELCTAQRCPGFRQVEACGPQPGCVP